MAAEPIRRRFTTVEYHAMADSGILSPDDRVELIEGEIWEMSPTGGPHFAGVARLDRAFQKRLGDEEAIIVIQSPIHLNDLSEPEPDVLVLRFRGDFYGGSLPTPADAFLLVEVADSSLEFDRRVKLDLYARNRVPEAWLVNLKQGTVEVYREPSPQGYGKPRIFRRGDRVSPLAFPGLQIEVAEILG